MVEDCLKQDHPAYTTSCDVYKKEKEILEVKYKRNESFLEAKKIVRTYKGENHYATVARRADTTNQDNKCRTLVEKLIQLEVNGWPKFQEYLKKKIHSAEFYQAPVQQRIGNGERSNVLGQIKTHIGSTTQTRTTPKSTKSPTKQPLHKSPICPPLKTN